MQNWRTPQGQLFDVHELCVIPKSCHQHVMRSLTPMFSLNPKTWSGNLLWISILHEKTQHHRFPLVDERYFVQHLLCPILEKRCHRRSALSLKWFSPKPLCHKGTKVVPLVKMEKENILEASRTWASCPPLSLSIWFSLSSRSLLVGS